MNWMAYVRIVREQFGELNEEQIRRAMREGYLGRKTPEQMVQILQGEQV